MSDCAHFGIIDKLDAERNYGDLGSPKEFQSALKIFRCISVQDELLESWMQQFRNVDTYFFSLSRPGKGLARTGVTLIPPKVLLEFIRIIKTSTEPVYFETVEFAELLSLLQEALQNKKYVIHYGV